ncbi:hypothetical protein HK103_002999 [Boothiomyces macroporosus]|uniref:Uncharacterized protein n=1 Tax=Boothiomyces macroporosus TaxID=261099 RepID=A0AAD5UJ03_9FUNG|nr:hypothetical protein HK103_002999 [Boothiomyces macroporosus]
MFIPLLIQLISAELASFHPAQEYGLSNSYDSGNLQFAHYIQASEGEGNGDGGLGDLYEDYNSTADTSSFPKEIIQPDSYRLVTRYSAVGTQNYVCNNTQWALDSANADLFTQPGQILAKHFFLDTPDSFGGRPTWKSNDGSQVTGQVLTKVVVDEKSVPWLVVQRTSGSNTGIFGQVNVVLRVKTVGGIAPSSSCVAGQTVKVNYSSDYWFYSANKGTSDMVKLTSSATRLSAGLIALIVVLFSQ